MRNKTIIQVMGMRSNKLGGLERFIVEVCSQLKQEGYKSIIIYEEEPASDQFIKLLEESDTQLFVMPARGRAFITFIPKFFKLLLKEKPITVHAHFDPAGYLAIFLSVICGVKNKFRSFRSSLNKGPNPCKSLDELSFKTKLLQRLQYRVVSRIFAVSSEAKNQYEKLFNIKKSKIYVLHMGVNPNYCIKSDSRNKYGLPDDKVILTCTAFHDPIKGVDLLLDAIEMIVKSYGITNFLVCQIGTGTDSEQLKAVAVEKNIDEYIKWMGLQNNVPEIFAASDIYVQPSRSEGIPIAIMEASTAGLPTVAFRVGGIPEAVEDGITGILTEPENSAALAKDITILIQNQKLREEYGLAAKELANREFNIKTQSRKMVTAYKS